MTIFDKNLLKVQNDDLPKSISSKFRSYFTIARDRLGPPEVARQVWHVASWGFKMLNQDYE